MADEETQSLEESLWWAFDASPDSSLPTATFDEPLEWPDALPWEEFDAGEARVDGFPDPQHLSFDLLFPPADGPAEADAEAEAGGQSAAGRPATAPPGGDPTELHLESLPESIWAPDPPPGDEPPRLVTITGSISADEGPAPLYAEAERSGGGRWRRWLALPRGNAAVVALICFASLVLLGMFLSVRARNELTTETSRTPTTQTTVPATRPLNTVALNPATTAAPPGSIALSDLVPPPDTAAQADAGAGSAPAGTTPRAAATTTTAPRSTAPAATQPTTATTAATPPPVDNPPPVTSPPSDDTTQTTRRTTPSSIDFPRTTYTLPSTSIPRPSITWPTGSNN